MHPDLNYHRSVLEKISPHIHRTPVLTSSTLNAEFNAEFFFKAEHLQRMGAFKMRGATHAILQLPADAVEKGVCTHSSGNHGQAVALAARTLGIPCSVIVPKNAPKSKVEAMEGYGARLIYCEATQADREATAADFQDRTGAYFIHPSNDEDVIWGQGTAALELMEDVHDLDILLVAVGGGGLLAGTCLAAVAMNPSIEIYAGEPELADDAKRSLQAGEIIPARASTTVADGLRTGLGSVNFPVIKEHVRDILTVSDPQIIEATRWTWERMKQVIEPSAGVPLAVVRAYPELFQHKRVGIILCGGNTDLSHLPF
ncbi:MAG: pyridoxal-phosphate dependent enzyme [Bacteroidetes bacterium]|nr:MAG: pyridoxal-phosphate dependent enzyme [Bacteroidota bacterium]